MFISSQLQHTQSNLRTAFSEGCHSHLSNNLRDNAHFSRSTLPSKAMLVFILSCETGIPPPSSAMQTSSNSTEELNAETRGYQSRSWGDIAISGASSGQGGGGGLWVIQTIFTP
jgi:hypothetical protein